MKVILTKDVSSLGQKDDMREVADGYARNFLLPRGLAVPATSGELKAWEGRRAAREAASLVGLKQAEELVKKLDGYELEMSAEANEEGTLYSAVGSDEIIAALQKNGFAIGRARIRLEEPLKSVGEHTVTLEFSHGLEAEIRVILSSAKAAAPAHAVKEIGSKKKAPARREKKKRELTPEARETS